MLSRIILSSLAALTLACSSSPPPTSPAGDDQTKNQTAGQTAGQTASQSAPLILISMDGFRWDYAERVATPNLDRLQARGVRAESLIPVFPSKTFPGHYSIATGLYVGNHGILSNSIRDPAWPEPFRMSDKTQVTDARWWQGEPIWVTAERQGRASAVCFWPGSEAAIKGVRPTDWLPFNAKMPIDDRVDLLLSWLDRPTETRPSLLLLWLGEPNRSGHRYGALAPETLAAAQQVDSALGRLLDGLDQRQLTSAVNIVVVSDHGMTDVDRQRVIVLDDLAELKAGEVFDQGAFLQIFTSDDARTEELYQALSGKHEHLAVYRRQDVPERFHVDHPRLPDIMGVPDVGWEVVTRKLLERFKGRIVKGDHGHDPQHPDMRGIFYAAGPAFVSGARIPALNMVDVYNVLAHALGIEPAENDGDAARLRGIVREPVAHRPAAR